MTIGNPSRLAVLLVGMLLTAVASCPAEAQPWTINIKNADLHEFISQVAAITEKTFVIDPRVKGNVTVISSTPMDKEAVYALFLSVLRVQNYIATPSGDVIRIQPNATGKQTPGTQGSLVDMAPEELVTRVVAAQNVESSELVKILRPLIPQYGHIAAVAKPNVVIISDHADNIVRMISMIRQIDVADEDEIIMLELKHAYVGAIVALLEKVAPDQIARGATGPQRIQLIANERNNTLVVRGKPRPLAEILKLVDKLDQPATSSGTTQVIYLKHADAVAVAEILNGILSSAATTTEEGAKPSTIQADESLNAIVVRADRTQLSEITAILEKLDIRRSQVLIEAAIVEVSIQEDFQLGVETAVVDTSGASTPLATTTLNNVINSLLGNLLPDVDGNVDFISGLASLNNPTLAIAKIKDDGLSFGAVVQALSSNSDANLLSTPSILTLDNQEAKIVVGNEVPFRTGSFTSQADGTNNPFTTIQREDVGLQLTVTPHVHDGTSVRLEVAQEVTNLIATAISSSDFSDVITSKRTIETTVLADNGQTIVLGGLIQDDINETTKKVPLLGSIPVLGRLFRSDTTSRIKRNLLVFLRPTVINSKEEAHAVTERKYEDLWEVEITSPGPIDDVYDGRN